MFHYCLFLSHHSNLKPMIPKFLFWQYFLWLVTSAWRRRTNSVTLAHVSSTKLALANVLPKHSSKNSVTKLSDSVLFGVLLWMPCRLLKLLIGHQDVQVEDHQSVFPTRTVVTTLSHHSSATVDDKRNLNKCPTISALMYSNSRIS